MAATASRPHLSAAYVSLALRLQESAPDLAATDAKAKLVTALMEMSLTEVGKRNSANDQQIIQTIHDHATALGAACNEPDADDMKEAAKPAAAQLKLKESQAFAVDIPLSEAFAAGTKIKLIAPGKGASAWYSEAALKKAATDKIFHAGLPMRIDHPTLAETQARPEGNETVITAEPKSDNLPYSKVEFTVGPTFEIHKLHVTNLDQTTLEFVFDTEKLNPPLANSLFQFQAPPGADVVDEGGGGQN